MDKKTFLKYLTMHGADFARWDGADVKAAAALMAEDDTLKAAYENEMALDNVLAHFSVPTAARADLQDKIITNVKVKKYADLEAPITAPSPMRALVMYGGGAFAVVAILLVASLMLGTNLPKTAGEGTPIQLVSAESALNNREEVPADILASVEESAYAVMEEEIASQEMDMLWQLAQADIPQSATPSSGSRASEAEIESFINEIFDGAPQPQSTPAESSDPALEQEMDLWDLYLQSESATL